MKETLKTNYRLKKTFLNLKNRQKSFKTLKIKKKTDIDSHLFKLMKEQVL